MTMALTPPATSNRGPIDFETELGPLPLQGKLPQGLDGTLIRNGPNPVVPVAGAHWFSGDGMLHAFRIAGGAVRYRNRWVRTERWKAARETGRPMPSGLQAGPKPPAETPPDDGTANTNVIAHAGRVLALEEAHLPIAVDAASLETMGVERFAGRLNRRFTAHPKTDPISGELVFFGYGAPEGLSSGMEYGVVSRDGRVLRLEHFEAPYASMVHDFAVSEKHVVIPVMPLTASRERAAAGRPPYAWEPEYGTRIGVMPRSGSVADIVWYEGPAAYVFHTMNAWEEGRLLHVDVMQFERPPLFPRPDGTPAGGPGDSARLVRWTFDLDDPRRTYTQTPLCDLTGEFPRIDDRRAGLPYRHGWFAGTGEHGFSSLVHIDLATRQTERYLFDEPASVSEPVFVPRRADADEGDGWILATVWDGRSNTSALAIFDAQRLAAGPVCTASLPHRVPDGFHGNWFGASAGEQSS